MRKQQDPLSPGQNLVPAPFPRTAFSKLPPHAVPPAPATHPVRQPGAEHNYYFVITDRFANGDPSNDTGHIPGTRKDHGFDDTDKHFYQGGDLAGLIAEMAYIAELGTTALWLTPCFENGRTSAHENYGSSGYHGYWITNFTKIDPHLGTEADLRRLIVAAHSYGIKVFIDIVVNHTGSVITYEQDQTPYVEKSDVPYLDAQGNAFDPAELAARRAPWPTLDPKTSFPYPPIVPAADQQLKVPSWLNDPTLYHNRGISTWEGESITYGDFGRLDDVMTEHPVVVAGFIEVYKRWMDFGVDGFRIDTVKHVNIEFWQDWCAAIVQHARETGKHHFFMFGEVYSFEPAELSYFMRKSQMDSVLDFAFQNHVTAFASGAPGARLHKLFTDDAFYLTPRTSAVGLPTFLGNHDMGRIGHFLEDKDHALARVRLAHELMYVGRGQPVIYYGDEQGFTGVSGGNDKDCRQPMFATKVADYIQQSLLTGEQFGTGDHFNQQYPLYQAIAALARLRKQHAALRDGGQFERFSHPTDGLYAFSRVRREEKFEYVVASNSTTSPRTLNFLALTRQSRFVPVYGADPSSAVYSGPGGELELTVAPLSTVVLRAGTQVYAPPVPAPVGPLRYADLSGTDSSVTTGQGELTLEVDPTIWQETTFSWRPLQSQQWTVLGTAEASVPRIILDLDELPQGIPLEFAAVSVDAVGNRSAASLVLTLN